MLARSLSLFSCVLCAALSFSTAAPGSAGEPSRKKLLLLYQGPDGHPAQTHEYKLGLELLHKLLKPAPGLEVVLTPADEPWREGPDLLAKVDGVVLFLSEGARWLGADPKRQAAFSDLAKRKGGLSVLHWAMGTKEAKYIDGFAELFGGCHGGPDRKYKVQSARLTLPEPKHPIAAGLKDFSLRD